VPSADDVKVAGETGRKLAALRGRVRLSVGRGKKAEPVALPEGAIRLLVEVLAEMGKGRAVAVLPVEARLTTQEAAELLGVSRPFVVKALRAGHIPHEMVGTHRRILLKDVMAYKRSLLRAQNRAMDALVKQAQELGLGY
jgi:excisionase family DNA binding protein